MSKAELFMVRKYVEAKNMLESFKNDERGEVNMIAIILLIIVVIGLAFIFRDQMSSLLETMFGKITSLFNDSADDLASH